MKIGDYEIEAELGVGGMAKVYRAKHAFLETMHAIKVLDPEYRANAEARRRFLDEAKIQAKHLAHRNIVKVTTIVATEQHAALVMELVEGGSLESVLHDLKGKPDEIKRIMLGVLDAIGHAHAAGIIHRDLKPANVLLAREAGELVPKVTDFGIAKLIDIGDKKEPMKVRTQFAARMGTLPYMSPEQIRRAKDVTARSDIWSLGAMLYELATGELPFPGESDFDVMESIVNGTFVPPATKHPGIDRRIAAVIEKALALDPSQRYASCAEMAAALRDAPRAATPPVPEAAQPSKSKLGLVAVVCLIGALGLGGAAIYLSRGSDSGTPTAGSASGSATGSGSAAVDPQRAVSALRTTAAQIDAPDPWKGTSATPPEDDPRAFPADGETPPSDAITGSGGLRYVITGGTGASPKVGDKVALDVRSWSIDDRKLVNSTIDLPPQEVIVQNDPSGEMLQRMAPGAVARVWVPASGTNKAGFLIAKLVSVTPAPRPALCTGTFKSGEDLQITVNGATIGVCGRYEFYAEGLQGPMVCAGDLTCLDGKASFACSYTKNRKMRLAGEMTFTCRGAALLATITIGTSKKDWLLHQVP